jgi:hypothetical protein
MESECEYLGNRSTECEVRVHGVFELLPRDRLLVFTPSTDMYSRSSQCIVDIDHCVAVGAISEPDGHFLLIRVEPGSPDMYFRYRDRRELLQFTDHVLAVQDAPILPDSRPKSEVALTVVPDYTGELELNTSPTHRPPISSSLSILSADKPAANYLSRRDMLLTSKMADEIKSLLPLEHRFSELRLVYSPKVHGISLPSFYRNCEHQPYPNIVIITDSQRCCQFGAYCSRPWDTRHSVRRQYFGTEDSFVFSLRRSGRDDITYFPATCINSLFQFCDDQRVVVGASGPAIVVFENWLRGTSTACETFGTTAPLACSSEFVVGDIEFWAIVPEEDGQGSPVS